MQIYIFLPYKNHTARNLNDQPHAGAGCLRYAETGLPIVTSAHPICWHNSYPPRGLNANCVCVTVLQAEALGLRPDSGKSGAGVVLIKRVAKDDTP